MATTQIPYLPYAANRKNGKSCFIMRLLSVNIGRNIVIAAKMLLINSNKLQHAVYCFLWDYI